MLEYLNGIGRPRRSGGGRKRHPHAKRTRKHKIALKKPSEMYKNLINSNAYKKFSPLAKARLLKYAMEQKRRAKFAVENEPLFSEFPMENEESTFIDDGEQEVDRSEFDMDGSPDSENGGEEMGLIYPGSEVNGIFSNLKARRKEKHDAKIEKRKAKSENKRSKADARRTKAQAKLEKGLRKGQGGAFDKVLDTAKSFSNKGGDDSESSDSGSGSSSRQSDPSLPAPTEKSFIEKNGMLLGIGAVAVLGFMVLGKKK